MPLTVLALNRYSALGASARQTILLCRDSLKDFGVDVAVSEFFAHEHFTATFSVCGVYSAHFARAASWRIEGRSTG